MKGQNSAPCTGLFTAISDNDADLVLHILREKTSAEDVNDRDVAHGLQTTLMRVCHMHVAAQQRAAILDVLRHKNPDVNIQDGSGRTALCHACIAEKTDVVRFLSTVKGTDPNVADTDGNTPLIYAVRSRNSEVVKCVLHCFAGAKLDTDHKNMKGQCALSEATKRCDSPICRLLVDEGGADTTPLSPMLPHRGARTSRPSTPGTRSSPVLGRRVLRQPGALAREVAQSVLLHSPFKALNRAELSCSSEPSLLNIRGRESPRYLQPFTANLPHQSSTSCNSLPDLQEDVLEESSSSEDEDVGQGPEALARVRRNSLSMPDLREECSELPNSPLLQRSSSSLSKFSSSKLSQYEDSFPKSGSPRLQRRIAQYTIKEEDPVEDEEEVSNAHAPMNRLSRLSGRRGSTSLPDLRNCVSLVSPPDAQGQTCDLDKVTFELSSEDSDTDEDVFELQCNSPVRMRNLDMSHQVALPDINRPQRQGFTGGAPKSARTRTSVNQRPAGNSPQHAAVRGYKLLTSRAKVKLSSNLEVSMVNGRRK